MKKITPRSGFTLIELLVVIAVIAVVAGVLGLSFGRGNSGTALQTAQGTLQSLASAARAQAALKQATVDIVVDANPESDGFLRTFYLVNGTTAVADPITMPTGVYLVPNNGETYSGAVIYEPTTSAWEDYESTAFAGTTLASISNVSGGPFRRVFGFNVRGTSTRNGRLVFAAAERRTSDTIAFTNPNALRGATLSNYGVLTLINDATAFTDTP